MRWVVVVAALVGASALLPDTLVGEIVEVDCFKTVELVFDQAVYNEGNLFDTYLLRLEVTDPSGNRFEIDGFYDGDGQGGQSGNIWKARLCPDQPGTWTWRTIPGDRFDVGLQGLGGQFEVTPSDDRGGLVADGRYFKLQDGAPLYLVGNFLDFVDGRQSTHVYMSETIGDAERAAIMARQRSFHDANKANIYLANKGDYGSRSVTPWVGTAGSNDKSRMDLSRWHLYDDYIRDFKDSEMLAELWFFADDSNFGSMTLDDQKRLIRYAMARTSAFTHTSYVLALEWQEGFSATRINQLGTYAQECNPWERVLSVHSSSRTNWQFGGQDWPTFIATQAGNSAVASDVNSYGLTIRSQDTLPHIDEEYGILRSDVDGRLRHNLWANLAGGAAGGGTGSDLAALQRFLEQSQMPFQRMTPDNSLVTSGGSMSFALAETGHHYLVFSVLESFQVNLSGTDLQACWFNPRDPEADLGTPFAVSAGLRTFTPPAPESGTDWILWITDGTNLTDGVTHLSGDATILRIVALLGDLNGDGFVGSDDLDIVRAHWGEGVDPGCAVCGDPSGDGVVGGPDLDIIRANWGMRTSPTVMAVPEPACLGIVGVLSLGLGFASRAGRRLGATRR